MVLETGKGEEVWTGLTSVWGKNYLQSQPASKLGVKTVLGKECFQLRVAVCLRHEGRAECGVGE